MSEDDVIELACRDVAEKTDLLALKRESGARMDFVEVALDRAARRLERTLRAAGRWPEGVG